jgi:hypothetical protein
MLDPLAPELELLLPAPELELLLAGPELEPVLPAPELELLLAGPELEPVLPAPELELFAPEPASPCGPPTLTAPPHAASTTNAAKPIRDEPIDRILLTA